MEEKMHVESTVKNESTNKIRIIELFGGIGAFTAAMKRLSIPHEVVDYVEIDKYACKSYNAINGTNFEPQDICQWDKDVKADVIMHGSPCQDFSIAGKQSGGDEGSNTRSSLMYETLRIVKKLKPKVVIWENVKNLLSLNHIHNFNAYIDKMAEMGYESNYKVLCAADYGIPQARQRVFTVSILNGTKFEFPKPIECPSIETFIDEIVDEKYYISEHFMEQIKNTKYRSNDRHKENTLKLANGQMEGFKIMDYRYDEGLRIRKNNLCPTLTTRGRQSISGVPLIYRDGKLRFITENEAWKLMGFSNEDFIKASKIVTEKDLYKQAGNSIVVNVLENIIKELQIEMGW